MSILLVVVWRRGEVRVGFVRGLGLDHGVGCGLVVPAGWFRNDVVFRLQSQLHAAADNRVLLTAYFDRIVGILRQERREAAGYGKSITGANFLGHWLACLQEFPYCRGGDAGGEAGAVGDTCAHRS